MTEFDFDYKHLGATYTVTVRFKELSPDSNFPDETHELDSIEVELDGVGYLSEMEGWYKRVPKIGSKKSIFGIANDYIYVSVADSIVAQAWIELGESG